MADFIARRNSKGNLTLYVDDVRFGTVFFRGDGTISGGCFTDLEVTECFNRLNMPIDTIPQVLARARVAYEFTMEQAA